MSEKTKRLACTETLWLMAMKLCRRSVQAGQFKWAYRQAEVDESNQDPSKHTVIMLHGLGSCSYAYR